MIKISVEDAIRLTVQDEPKDTRPGTVEEGLPDRMSIDSKSLYYSDYSSFVGVRLDGVEQSNATAYCVSGGWVDAMPDGVRATSYNVSTQSQRKSGRVEAYWRVRPSRQVRRQLARGK